MQKDFSIKIKFNGQDAVTILHNQLLLLNVAMQDGNLVRARGLIEDIEAGVTALQHELLLLELRTGY